MEERGCGETGRVGKNSFTKRPQWTNSSFVHSLPFLLMQPRGGAGPRAVLAPAAAATFSPPRGEPPRPGRGRGGGGDLHRVGPGAGGQISPAPPPRPLDPALGPARRFLFRFAARVPRGSRPDGPASTCNAPERSPGRGSPQPLLALLRGELVEGLGVLLAQEGLVVVLEALVVLGRPLA